MVVQHELLKAFRSFVYRPLSAAQDILSSTTKLKLSVCLSVVGLSVCVCTYLSVSVYMSVFVLSVCLSVLLVS